MYFIKYPKADSVHAMFLLGIRDVKTAGEIHCEEVSDRLPFIFSFYQNTNASKLRRVCTRTAQRVRTPRTSFRRATITSTIWCN